MCSARHHLLKSLIKSKALPFSSSASASVPGWLASSKSASSWQLQSVAVSCLHDVSGVESLPSLLLSGESRSSASSHTGADHSAAGGGLVRHSATRHTQLSCEL